MCLITFAYKTHPDYRLLLVANRDEFYARPTEFAEPWPGNEQIVGGRDLQAGGSWLAVSNAGRFAAVTNFREGIIEAKLASRGALVSEFLLSEESPEQWASKLEPRFSHYNGFNLLLGTRDSLYYLSNRTALATDLKPGLYSLSNHLLDSPWPKADYAKKKLQQCINDENLGEDRLAETLSRKQPFADNLLPDTGVTLEMERTLSAPFIQTETYGTRCTTVIKWFADKAHQPGKIAFYEQSFLNDGSKGVRREYPIDILMPST